MIMARNRCYLPQTGHDHETHPRTSVKAVE